MNTEVQNGKRIFWHRDLPPLTAELVAEHTLEADSGRVTGTFAYRDELWIDCYDELMITAARRLIQEMDRLDGDYAHIHDEFISPRHDAASGQSWLHGRFTYMLYRQPRATVTSQMI